MLASIADDGNRKYRILFNDADGRRRVIRLSKIGQRQAEAFRLRVEILQGARVSGGFDAHLAKWLVALPDKLHGKLGAAGALVRPRARSASTMAAFLVDFFASVQVKASTLTTYDQTRRVVVEHFGEDKPLREIGPLEAEKWRQWLKAKGLADSTIARRVKTADVPRRGSVEVDRGEPVPGREGREHGEPGPAALHHAGGGGAGD